MKKKKLKDCKSLDEIEDNDLVWELFNSPEFKDTIRKNIEAATWGKDRPMIYIDDDGWVVKHWKDGTIEKIKKT